MRVLLLLGLTACAATAKQQQDEDALLISMPVPPVMPVGAATPVIAKVDTSLACDPELGRAVDIFWMHGSRSAFPAGKYTLQGNCLTGIRATGTYRMRVDDNTAAQIADLVPSYSVQLLQSPETLVHLTMDGRDVTYTFEPTPTCTNQFGKTPPDLLKLELLLYGLEKHALDAPYSLIVPRIVPPAEPIISGQPTKLHIQLENRGRIPVTVPRDVNAVEVNAACEACGYGNNGPSRVSVAAEPAQPIEIPVGMGREVEIVAYFRQPGVNRVVAWLDASRSEPLMVTVSN